MKYYFLVVCNDHNHCLAVMKHYYEKFPTAVANTALKHVMIDNIVFVFMSRNTDPHQLLSSQFLGVVYPPGYEGPMNFENTAMTRTRWT
jgi:hypothetical protein